jgi:hypothetical protein
MQDGGRSFIGGPDDRGRHGNGRQGGGAGPGNGRHENNRADEQTRAGTTPVNRAARPQQSRYFSNDLANSVDDRLFEKFEDDYRSGSDYDTEFHRGVRRDDNPGFGGDRDLDQDFDRDFDRDPDRDFDGDDRADNGAVGRDDDRDDEWDGGRGRLRSRHGRGKGRRQRETEGAAFIPLFSRKAKAAESSAGFPSVARSQARSSANTRPAARKPIPDNPFGDLGGYLVPILVAVVIVMVLVVLLLNR